MNDAMQQIAADGFADALDAFGEAVIFDGQRRETGASASRAMRCAVTAIVGSPQDADEANGAVASGKAMLFNVRVSRATWPDHTPPQPGDTVTTDGYGVIRVQPPVIPTGYGWQLSCVSRGAA